ncbi:MAG TPA: WD40 repeat domain-containing protein, partial [Kofleriaceae bacterium]|nr:WD40 repeat domain-containing protein [Kofleriaceae bacterium]
MNKAIRVSLPLALGAGLIAALALPASAVVTSTWTVETYQQFDAGDASNAFITSTGELRAGWNTKRTALEGDAVWSALRLADGSVLLGSDADGTVYRVSGDTSKKVASIPNAIAVVALAQTSDGTVWAGTMPGNKLYKIDVAGGKATASVTLGQTGKTSDVETVWSLAASGNTLYAGTGPSGKLYAISGGTAKEVFDTDDKRITALTTTSDGKVWLGTSERAVVFRYDPSKNEARAMADFAGNEISSLAPYRDGVVAAANDLPEAVVPTGKT